MLFINIVEHLNIFLILHTYLQYYIKLQQLLGAPFHIIFLQQQVLFQTMEEHIHIIININIIMRYQLGLHQHQDDPLPIISPRMPMLVEKEARLHRSYLIAYMYFPKGTKLQLLQNDQHLVIIHKFQQLLGLVGLLHRIIPNQTVISPNYIKYLLQQCALPLMFSSLLLVLLCNKGEHHHSVLKTNILLLMHSRHLQQVDFLTLIMQHKQHILF